MVTYDFLKRMRSSNVTGYLSCLPMSSVTHNATFSSIGQSQQSRSQETFDDGMHLDTFLPSCV